MAWSMRARPVANSFFFFYKGQILPREHGTFSLDDEAGKRAGMRAAAVCGIGGAAAFGVVPRHYGRSAGHLRVLPRRQLVHGRLRRAHSCWPIPRLALLDQGRGWQVHRGMLRRDRARVRATAVQGCDSVHKGYDASTSLPAHGDPIAAGPCGRARGRGRRARSCKAGTGPQQASHDCADVA